MRACRWIDFWVWIFNTGWYLILVFEMKRKGIVRVITGWDMDDAEKRRNLPFSRIPAGR